MDHKKILFLSSIFFIFFSSTFVFSKEVIPFGFCPKYDLPRMLQLYQPFIRYLNENTPYQFEMKLSHFYQETIGKVGQGEIPIASCGPIPYIKAREKFKVEPILRTLNKDGHPYYRGVIITRVDSPIRNLQDLKGRSFAFGEEWSTTGHIFPRCHLLKSGIDLKDLKQHAFLRNHDFVVEAVFNREFDAGAVKDVVAYKYETKGLRFISITDPIPAIPIFVKRDARKEMVQSVKMALLRLNPKNPDHQKTMAQWDDEFRYGFTEAADSDYDPVRKILDFLEKKTGAR
ncbi:MAG: phosphate/phosphite/phosphonate ABC transporter substrate-binding protein [Syntrophaceae bacterium]|nr:phosphate/phosphite/phosphonate ABC transporter substrate-binding protein [Syntrophaceae bacterium]